MCTPYIINAKQEREMCTPYSINVKEEREMCTPYSINVKEECEMCTPYSMNVKEERDMCTPYSINVHVLLGAVPLRETKSLNGLFLDHILPLEEGIFAQELLDLRHCQCTQP